jgi:hypothetical protein
VETLRPTSVGKPLRAQTSHFRGASVYAGAAWPSVQSHDRQDGNKGACVREHLVKKLDHQTLIAATVTRTFSKNACRE